MRALFLGPFFGAAAAILFSLSSPAVHAAAAKPESAVGLGYGIYQGPTDQYIAPQLAPGINFSQIWLGRRVHWVSKFEVAPLVNGERFAGSSSSFAGLAVTHKFHPKFFIFNRDAFRPYVAAGTLVGAYGLFLTDLSTSSSVSNNQASLKFGYTIGIGGDFWRKGSFDLASGSGGESTGNGMGLQLEYFQYLPTLQKIQFQAGRIEARGLHFTISWIFGAPSS